MSIGVEINAGGAIVSDKITSAVHMAGVAVNVRGTVLAAAVIMCVSSLIVSRTTVAALMQLDEISTVST